jgi:uncharacterized GH25 family protein
MNRKALLTLALAGAAAAPLSLRAHRQWMLPSATVLSKADSWVTIDAAVSNELFYFDHVPMRLNNLVVTAPDGSTCRPENAATGKYRSTFDIHLTRPGTYRIASVSNMAFASWNENGEQKMWRGDAAAMAKEVPANASGLKTSKMAGRVEVFVTAGKPDMGALKPTGIGLELAPVTHPNDLVNGEPASFRFLQDGKPAAGLEVSVIPGGIRYRDNLNEQKIKTDSEGRFTVTFPVPGMYWINATTGAGGRGPGGPGAPGSPGGMRIPAGDRASYVATLEVLPQ